MYDLAIYSLKVGVCIAVFYLFFKLLLSRETFHRLNRVLILCAVIVSFLLPVCVITIEKEIKVVPQIELTIQGNGSQFTAVAAEPQPVAAFPWEEAGMIVFAVGIAVSLGWTLWSLAVTMRMIRRGRCELLDDGIVLSRHKGALTPFSWGRWIVISDDDYAESGVQIVTHERAHIRCRHSLDLLLTDLLSCLQWFNPAMWLLRRELRAIHEYEADAVVLASGADAKQYQLLLIKKAVGERWYSVANSLNHSNLKNRITMMLRKKSSRWAIARTLIVLPLLCVAIGAFAQTSYVVSNGNITKNSEEEQAMAPGGNTGGMQVTEESTMTDSDGMTFEKVKITTPGSLRSEDGILSTADTQLLMWAPSNAKSDTTVVRVTTTTELGGDNVENQTVVITTDCNVGSGNIPDDVLIIMNGRKVSKADLDRLAKNTIESVNVEKPKDGIVYDGKNYSGILHIGTKGENKGGKAESKTGNVKMSTISLQGDIPDNVLVMIDGRKSSKEDLLKLENNSIVSVNINKLDDLITEYDGLSYESIINVVTKKGEKGVKTESKTMNIKAGDLPLAGSIQSITVDKSQVGSDKSGMTVVNMVTDNGKKGTSESSTFVVKMDDMPASGIPDNVLIVINGRKATKADLDCLDKNRIKSVNVKQSEAAVKKYVKKGYAGGVIEIVTKK